jgi:hypothetical protein
MSSYVHVETSAEEIQDDEDLIEAVGQIVAFAGEAIYTDIKNDVSGVYFRMMIFLDANFPFLIYWREDRSLLWADLQKIGIFALLFVVTFILLAPSKRWSKKLHPDKRSLEEKNFLYFRRLSPFHKTSDPPARPGMERRRSTSSIDFRQNLAAAEMGVEFEETEEEKFARRWQGVLETSYRHVVLPPDCKRVEKPKKTKEDSKKEKTSKGADKSENHDDDHPANRLLTYTRNILYLAFSFLRYDYVLAGWTLIHWVEACFRSRQSRTNGDNEDYDDDESDAGSLRSSSFATQSNSMYRTPPRQGMRGKRDSVFRKNGVEESGDKGATNDSSDDVSHTSLSIEPSMTDDSEEKKESTSDRDQHSYETPPISPLSSANDPARPSTGPGIYSTPAQQESTEELDPGDALATKIFLNGRQPKLKDALQVSIVGKVVSTRDSDFHRRLQWASS